jgi:hypothetical protein
MLTAPPMTIEAEIEFSRAGKGSTMELSIYNVSPATKKECEQKAGEPAKIILNCGYADEGGKSTVFMGDIIKTDIEPGIDDHFKITSVDATAKFLTVPISVSYKSKMKASQLIADVASRAGITAMTIDLENDKEYETYAVNSPFGQFLDRISNKNEANTFYYFRQGQLIFRNNKQDTAQAIVLNHNTGLLFAEKIEKNQKKSVIKGKAIFQNKMTAGSYLVINRDNVQGNFIVDKGKHQISSQSESVTEFEAVPL